MQKINNEARSSFLKSSEKLMKVGFYMGLASLFLGFIGITPLCGMILSITGVIQYDTSKNGELWMGILGIIINILISITNAYQNGHI